MDKLLIEGQQSLTGSVKISGAKNSVLPMLCASVMVSDGLVELENISPSKTLQQPQDS